MTDILDHVEGEEYINPEDIDERAILGDDYDDPSKVKKEDDGDDLYDAAMEPSALNEKRDSVDSASAVSLVKQETAGGGAALGGQHATAMLSAGHQSSAVTSGSGGSVTGKRYCCYIGNMTWWTTDVDIQNAVASCGVNLFDFVDLKFHENRNNGQSKGFALAVFAAESAVRAVSDKLALRKVNGQSLVVLPYNKQSLSKLEDATKRVDTNAKKDDKQGMLNIGTVRIGPAGSTPLGGLAMGRPPITQPPTNLMNITFPAGGPPGPGGPQFQLRGTAGTTVASSGSIPALLQTHINPAGGMAANGAVGTLAAGFQPQQSAQSQQQVQQPTAATLGFSGPPPATNVPPPSVLSRPPPGMAALPPSAQPGQMVVNTSAPPPGIPGYTPGAVPPLRTVITPQHAQPTAAGQPGFPPGAHINPQVYPSFAQGYAGGATGGHQLHPHHQPQPISGNGALISEAEFEEIMNRNRTVSSSAINRAVSDATAGDYGSAIETLVTAISLIRQSRVSGDDRCKVLIAALQDTLQGIESKSYNSRKHRSHDRSPSDRSGGSRSKRHRGRGSRSRSRSRDRYDYSSRRY